MGKYLELIRGVRRPELEKIRAESREREKAEALAAESANGRRLVAAGWKPKVSFGGKVIWQRPDNGFYYSEEAALCLMSRMEGSLQERGKRLEVTQRERVT
jgi:hypothetical protein